MGRRVGGEGRSKLRLRKGKGKERRGEDDVGRSAVSPVLFCSVVLIFAYVWDGGVTARKKKKKRWNGGDDTRDAIARRGGTNLVACLLDFISHHLLSNAPFLLHVF